MKVENIVPLSWIRVTLVVAIALFASMIFEPLIGMIVAVPPSLTLSVVCVVAAFNGPLYGVVSGMIAGFMLDLLGAGALGVNMGSFAVVGFVAGKAVRLLPPWHRLVRIAFVAPVMVLHIPIARIFSVIAGDSAPIAFRFALAFLAVNVACAMLITPVISSFEIRSSRA